MNKNKKTISVFWLLSLKIMEILLRENKVILIFSIKFDHTARTFNHLATYGKILKKEKHTIQDR